MSSEGWATSKSAAWLEEGSDGTWHLHVTHECRGPKELRQILQRRSMRLLIDEENRLDVLLVQSPADFAREHKEAITFHDHIKVSRLDAAEGTK